MVSKTEFLTIGGSKSFVYRTNLAAKTASARQTERGDEFMERLDWTINGMSFDTRGGRVLTVVLRDVSRPIASRHLELPMVPTTTIPNIRMTMRYFKADLTDQVTAMESFRRRRTPVSI
jgi:hypothetical protein